MTWRSTLLTDVALAGASLQAQAPHVGVERPTFDVVSIKPEAPDAPPRVVPSVPFVYPPGSNRLRSPAINAMTLILNAFGGPDRISLASQVEGAPAWVTSTRFEIVATVPDGMNRDEATARFSDLVRAMLEDRFKLQAHIDQRPRPVYALAKARPSGSLGPQIHESSTDCDAVTRDQVEKQTHMSREDFIRLMMASALRCGMRGDRDGGFQGAAMTMASIASALNGAVDRPVVDRSGIPGRFDLTIKYSSRPLAATDTPVLADRPSVFVAVQEQLGLKLEPREEPMNALRIDHIEPPTPN